MPSPGGHILFPLEGANEAEDEAQGCVSPNYLEDLEQGFELSSLSVWKPPERSVARTCLLMAASLAGSRPCTQWTG